MVLENYHFNKIKKLYWNVDNKKEDIKMASFDNVSMHGVRPVFKTQNDDSAQVFQIPSVQQWPSLFPPPNSSDSSNSITSINDIDLSKFQNYDDSSNGGFLKAFLGMFRGPEQTDSTNNQQTSGTTQGAQNMGNPGVDAQRLADAAGITLEEAQEVMQGADDSSQGPDAVAQKLADTKGCTLDEAKEILKGIFGDPQAQDAQGQDSQNIGNPDADAQRYADINGISFESAKEILQGIYDEPEQLDS